MRRSKARDLSEITVPNDPLHLPEYPLTLSVEPRRGRNRQRISFDFGYLAPLEQFGRQLVAAVVAACREGDRERWSNITASVHPFLKDLATRTADDPQGWTADQWKSWADERLGDMFNSPKWGQGTKNVCRAHFSVVLKAAFAAKTIPQFKLRGMIKKAVQKSKTPIAQAPKTGEYAHVGDDDTIKQAALRLNSLKEVNNPDVHKERHEILLGLLSQHCQKLLRAAWEHFKRSQMVIRSKTGLNAKKFVQIHVTFGDDISIDDAGYRLLRSRSDYLRLLSHPAMYKGLIFRKLPSRLQRRLSRHGGINWYHSALHLTPSTAAACEGLLLIDLHNEVSSILGMKRADIGLTQNRKSARIGWYKGRSHEFQEEYRERGTVQSLNMDSNLPISSFVVAKVLNVMRRRLRPFARPEFRDHLFLVTYPEAHQQNVAHVLSMDRANNEVIRLRGLHPILSKHHFAFDKLRGSILFDGHLKHENILKTSRDARHRNLRTTQRYINHAAADMRSVEYVREVQDLLALFATEGPLREKLGGKLGITEERAKRIYAKADSTGFGQWKTGGEQPAREIEFKSSFQRFLAHGELDFLEDVGIAAEIFAYRRHLLAEASSIRGSPDWYDFWAPLLLMLNVAWHSFRADIRLDAVRLADELHIEYMDAA